MDEINGYLKEQTEGLKKTHPEIFEHIEKMNQLMANAKEEPTGQCKEEQEHNFSFMATADTREEAIYYFQCENCEEVIVKKQVRSSDDIMRHI